MAEGNKKMTTCSVCGAEIAKNAKVCPKCGNKNKKSKKWIIAIIAIFIIIIAITNSGNKKTDTKDTSVTTENSKAEEKVIEYTAYDVSELINDLENNALKAENKYNNQYVELTGKLANIDSDGKYISLNPSNNEFTLINVLCYIKNDEQKQKVTELNKGDIITVRGKIKSVGEVMGYSLDIDEIVN